jgi:V8-like Glu-specific endopeptidase
MPSSSSEPRTVSGGVLLPDATKSFPGQKGTLSDAVDAATLEGGAKLVSVHDKAPRRPRARRMANHSRRPAPQSGTFDDDLRVRVANPRAYPFSAVCAVRSFFPGGKVTGGTGFLVGPRLLLTAGHNIIADGQAVDQVLVYPALNGSYENLLLPSALASRWLTVNFWKESENPAYDYGALVLPTDVGTRVGWLSIEKRADGDFFSGLPINTAGYPLDCPAPAGGACPIEEGTWMWADQGSVNRVDGQKIYYSNLKMAEGDSGAPIFTYRPGDRTEYFVIGIHTYLYEMEYWATRINDGVYRLIGEWLDESTKAPAG